MGSHTVSVRVNVQAPLTKQALSPPLSEVQRQYLERADKALYTGKPVEPRTWDASPAACDCISYHELLISARIDDYTTFVGHYSHGKREGEGMFFYSDGTTYSGHWRGDKCHGEGALLNASCEVIYEGQFVRTAIYELCREIEINPDVEHELRQRFAL